MRLLAITLGAALVQSGENVPEGFRDLAETRAQMLSDESEVSQKPLNVLKAARPRPTDDTLYLRRGGRNCPYPGDHTEDIKLPLHKMALLELETHVNSLGTSHHMAQSTKMLVEQGVVFV